MTTYNEDDGVSFIDDTETVDVSVDGRPYAANYIIEEGNLRLTTSPLPDGKRRSVYAPVSVIASPSLASEHRVIAKHMLLNLIAEATRKASDTPAA